MALTVKTKISLGVLGAVAAAMWPLHEWIAGHATRELLEHSVQAQELGKQIKTAVDAAQKAAEAAKMVAESLAIHVDQTDLADARRRLDLAKTDLATTQLWEAANRPNEISRARVRDLQGQIDRVSAWIACKEAGRPNCGTL